MRDSSRGESGSQTTSTRTSSRYASSCRAPRRARSAWQSAEACGIRWHARGVCGFHAAEGGPHGRARRLPYRATRAAPRGPRSVRSLRACSWPPSHFRLSTPLRPPAAPPPPAAPSAWARSLCSRPCWHCCRWQDAWARAGASPTASTAQAPWCSAVGIYAAQHVFLCFVVLFVSFTDYKTPRKCLLRPAVMWFRNFCIFSRQRCSRHSAMSSLCRRRNRSCVNLPSSPAT